MTSSENEHSAPERVCSVPVAADPYNGDACGEEAGGLRFEPTCSPHLDYFEVFRHQKVWRTPPDDEWDPIDDATDFLRQRNIAVEELARLTGERVLDVLERIRDASEEARRG